MTDLAPPNRPQGPVAAIGPDEIAELRVKAERALVYPLNRDECLSLVGTVETLFATSASWEKVARQYEMALSDRGLL